MSNLKFYTLLLVAIFTPDISFLFSDEQSVGTERLFVSESSEAHQCPAGNIANLPIADNGNKKLSVAEDNRQLQLINEINNKLKEIQASNVASLSKKDELESQKVTSQLSKEQLTNKLVASQNVVEQIIASGVLTQESNIHLMQLLQGVPIEQYKEISDQFFKALDNQQIDMGGQIPLF